VLCFPEEVGCFALREKGGFIVAMRNAIWLADKRGLLVQKVCDNPSNPQLARFNDGGTDHLGRFYAGTFWGPGDYNGALLMRIDNDLKPTVIQCDIQAITVWHLATTNSGCLPLIRQMALSIERRWMSRGARRA
jgi:sugar lactone lactonase YvrE